MNPTSGSICCKNKAFSFTCRSKHGTLSSCDPSDHICCKLIVLVSFAGFLIHEPRFCICVCVSQELTKYSPVSQIKHHPKPEKHSWTCMTQHLFFSNFKLTSCVITSVAQNSPTNVGCIKSFSNLCFVLPVCFHESIRFFWVHWEFVTATPQFQSEVWGRRRAWNLLVWP